MLLPSTNIFNISPTACSFGASLHSMNYCILRANCLCVCLCVRVLSSQCEYELGVQDCEKALILNEECNKALYRKALCLKELGLYKEAYGCTTECLSITRLVRPRGHVAHYPRGSLSMSMSFSHTQVVVLLESDVVKLTFGKKRDSYNVLLFGTGNDSPFPLYGTWSCVVQRIMGQCVYVYAKFWLI